METQLKRYIAFARAPGAALSSIRSATRMQCRRIILSGAATHGTRTECHKDRETETPRTVDQHAKEHPRWHPATSDWLAPDRRDDEPSHERQGDPAEEQSNKMEAWRARIR